MLDNSGLMSVLREPRNTRELSIAWVERFATWAGVQGCTARMIPDGGVILENLGAERGTGWPCYVAHADTVGVPWCKALHWTGSVVRGVGGQIGADDGAGLMAIMMMIGARHPGFYVVTLDEERGGLGAKIMAPVIAEMHKERIIACCIEVDRRGTRDIVWDHATGATGSRAWAEYVAMVLCMGHTASSEGVFTDICYFTGVPGLNVAAGYQGAHSTDDSLDVDYLRQVTARLMAVDHLIAGRAELGVSDRRSMFERAPWAMDDWTGPAHSAPLQFDSYARYHDDGPVGRASTGYTFTDLIEVDPAFVARWLIKRDKELARSLKRALQRRWVGGV